MLQAEENGWHSWPSSWGSGRLGTRMPHPPMWDFHRALAGRHRFDVFNGKFISCAPTQTTTILQSAPPILHKQFSQGDFIYTR